MKVGRSVHAVCSLGHRIFAISSLFSGGLLQTQHSLWGNFLERRTLWLATKGDHYDLQSRRGRSCWSESIERNYNLLFFLWSTLQSVFSPCHPSRILVVFIIQDLRLSLRGGSNFLSIWSPGWFWRGRTGRRVQIHSCCKSASSSSASEWVLAGLNIGTRRRLASKDFLQVSSWAPDWLLWSPYSLVKS